MWIDRQKGQREGLCGLTDKEVVWTDQQKEGLCELTDKEKACVY